MRAAEDVRQNPRPISRTHAWLRPSGPLLPAGRSTRAFHSPRSNANDQLALAYLDIDGEGLAVSEGPAEVDGMGAPAISDTDLSPMSIGVPGKMMLW
jgi:hypothetical protein